MKPKSLEDRKHTAIIRRNSDGSVDDVVIACDTFRLEQMGNDSFWACAERGNKHVMFIIRGKNLICQDYEDDLGCIDDTAER